MEEPTSIMSYLTYDELKIIFEYLDGRNLASAAMVCRSWLEAANIEKSRRGPSCFVKLNMECNFLDNFFIRNIRIKPSAIFFFMPKEFLETGSVNYILVCLYDLLRSLPKHCKVIILYDNCVIMEEKTYTRYPQRVCALLPEVLNVKVEWFDLHTEYDYLIEGTLKYWEIIKTIDNNKTSNHEASTCFMIFCNNDDESINKAALWTSAIQQSTKNKLVSVWGGAVVYLQVHADLHEDPENIEFLRRIDNSSLRDEFSVQSCVGVLITGLIRTWSTVLERECNTEEQIEARLKLFKDKVKLKRHSIGFVFINLCDNDYDEDDDNMDPNEANKKAQIFKKLFPKVPLVGCGSYYFNEIIAIDEMNKKKKTKPKSWYEGFAMFSILTYG